MSSKNINFPQDWIKPKSPGFGTYPGPYGYLENQLHYDAVRAALESGYTHIDHAQAYENDEFVGKALATFKERERLFITSKLLPENNSYKGALNGIKEVLTRLQLKYLDLYLIHYPGEGNPIEAWKGLMQAKDDGLCKHIGVSNFEIKHLKRFYEVFGHYPEVNQIEFQPFLYGPDLKKLVEFCHQNGIVVEGYCVTAWPIMRRADFSRIDSIASNYKKSRTQILMKWCMQHGLRPLSGSRNPTHIRENLGSYDFVLSADEMAELDSLGRNMRCSLTWGKPPWDPTSVDF